jgi:hypothetical protein
MVSQAGARRELRSRGLVAAATLCWNHRGHRAALDAKLEVVVIPHLTGPAPPGMAVRKGLAPGHGWRYRAHGEIVSTRPLRADLGPLHLELDHVDAGAFSVGDPVSVAIDRIILTRERG